MTREMALYFLFLSVVYQVLSPSYELPWVDCSLHALQQNAGDTPFLFHGYDWINHDLVYCHIGIYRPKLLVS